MKSPKNIILSGIIMFSCSAFSFAQDTKSVSGVVTAFERIPLNNVTVLSQKSGEKVTTNSDGQFSVMCTKKDILIISAAGFRSEKVKIGNQAVYKIDMAYEDNLSNFNEAVANGHISEDVLKKAIAQKSKASEEDYSKYKSVYELVSSEIYNVRIKGTTILNTQRRSTNGEPVVLCVVDNKIVTDISFVSPVDVKRVEFIDGVEASFYGQQGANGVLKITLK